jgi:Conjugative transposon protein TcpC
MAVPPTAQSRASVSLSTKPLWRIRLARELPRYTLCALSLTGLVASARFAIDPPRPAAVAMSVRTPSPPDRAAEGYASLFARRYLTWNAAEPQASQQALASFVGGGMEANAGLQLPQTGEQRVEWVEVVQEREPVPGEHVYTVAAQTDTAGLLYMTVSVIRRSDGSLALGGYPAFVGAPASGRAQTEAHVREVADPELATVVERALRNYLDASAGELAADLTSGARVSLPAMALSLGSVQRLDWSPAGDSVIAVVQARDARGVQYTLGYELDTAREQGRWEISAVQMDPDA